MPLERQGSFHGGELAPVFYGRTDHPAYAVGLRLCLNFLPTAHGSILNRPGTKQVVEVKDSTARTRVGRFVFSDGQSFAIEFGNLYVRFVTNGGQVLNAGLPVEVVTPYLTADLFKLQFAQSGDVITITCQGYQPRELARISNTSWTLTTVSFANQEPWVGGTLASFDSVKWDSTPGAYSNAVNYAVGNRVTFTDGFTYIALQINGPATVIKAPAANSDYWAFDGYSATTVYAEGDYVYTADASGAKGVLFISLQPRNFGHTPSTATAWWALAADTTHTAKETAWAYTFIWKDSAGVKRETLAHHVKVTSPSGKWPRFIDRPARLLAINSPLGGVAFFYQIVAVRWYAGRQGIFGWVGDVLSDGTTSGTPAFIDQGDAPDFTIQPPAGADPFLVADGAGTATTHKYPSAATYHEQRLLFGGTAAKPATFMGSAAGDLKRFDVKWPVLAADSYEFALAATVLEDIRSMLSMNGLVIFTGAGIWTARGANGTVLSPLSVDVRKRSKRGASYLQPIEIGGIALWNTAKANRVRDLVINWAALNDASIAEADLTVLARHLFDGHTLVDWAYAEEPYSIVWCVRDDGVLLSLTYHREMQTVAWAQHVTDGVVESVCCVPEGTEDAVYLVVKRTINGVTRRYIERMASRYVPDVRKGCFLDAALVYDGRIISGATATVANVVGQEADIVASLATFSAGDVGSVVVLDPDGTDYTSATAWDGAAAYGAGAVVSWVGKFWFSLGATTGAQPDISSSTWAPAAGPFRCTILSFTSTTQVHVVMDQPVGPRSFATAKWAIARTVFTGLSTLEAKSVGVLADGGPQGPVTVSGASITITTPAVDVIVGLPYNSDLELLDYAPAQVKTNVKAVARVSFEVVASRGLWAGEDFTPATNPPSQPVGTLIEAPPRTVADSYGMPALFTGTVDVPIASDWNQGGRAVLRQKDPLPLTVNAVIREIVVGGRG